MKRCPKCRADYFDNMLDYCLEDGAKLAVVSGTQKEVQTVAFESKPIENQTVPFQIPPTEAFDKARETGAQKPFQANTEKIKTSLTNKWYKFLEITPMVLALMHNYWQWLYLEKQGYYQLTSFLFSANFLLWLLLLISGVVFGIISIKYGKSKNFAITALVVLAINFLLFIVPK